MKIFNTMENGYRFNKLIFLSVMGILISTLLINLMSNGYEQHPYLICSSDNCENPFATSTPYCNGIYCPPIKCDEDWCTREYLTRGEYGQKPGFIQTNFKPIAFSLFILSFILNHLIYNRKVKFSLPTKRKLLPDWMAKIISKIFPKFNNEIDYKKVAKRMSETEDDKE